jgi:hypothetical protein
MLALVHPSHHLSPTPQMPFHTDKRDLGFLPVGTAPPTVTPLCDKDGTGRGDSSWDNVTLLPGTWPLSPRLNTARTAAFCPSGARSGGLCGDKSRVPAASAGTSHSP